MNPLEWSSHTFNEFFLPLLPFSLAAAWILKDLLNQPAHVPTPEQLDLDPYLVALLVGEQAAVETARAALTHEGVTSLPARAMPLERAVYGALHAGKRSVDELRAAAEPVLVSMRATLRARGMLRTAAQDFRYRWYPLGLFLAVLGLGLVRLVVSLAHGQPGTFLLLLLLGGVGLARVLCWHAPTSRQGARAVKMLRLEHAALYETALAGGLQSMTPEQRVLSLGLFGTGSLARLQDPTQRDVLFPPPDSDDGG